MKRKNEEQRVLMEELEMANKARRPHAPCHSRTADVSCAWRAQERADAQAQRGKLDRCARAPRVRAHVSPPRRRSRAGPPQIREFLGRGTGGGGGVSRQRVDSTSERGAAAAAAGVRAGERPCTDVVRRRPRVQRHRTLKAAHDDLKRARETNVNEIEEEQKKFAAGRKVRARCYCCAGCLPGSASITAPRRRKPRLMCST